jgi:hypothetical protein
MTATKLASGNTIIAIQNSTKMTRTQINSSANSNSVFQLKFESLAALDVLIK